MKTKFQNTPQAYAPVVDRLAEIKAKLADLSEEEKNLKAVLEESGFEAVDGTLLRATISHVEGRVTVDWAGVADKYKEMLEKHGIKVNARFVNEATKQGAPYVVVRLAARKQEK